MLIATNELIYQNKEKEKRAQELLDSYKALAHEKEKRATELVEANKELVIQNEEKAIREEELIMAYKELQKVEGFLKDHIQGLEKMMVMTSHKVRQPIAQILGLSNLLDQFLKSPKKLKVIVEYIKESALTLDAYTKELTKFMSNMEKKVKK